MNWRRGTSIRADKQPKQLSLFRAILVVLCQIAAVFSTHAEESRAEERNIVAIKGNSASLDEKQLAFTSLKNSQVVQLEREGKALEALELFFQLPETQREVSAVLAAGRAAWSLGLVERAREFWSELDSKKLLSGVEASRMYLAWAILEFQENEYKKGLRLALEGADGLPRGALRAQCWHIAGDSAVRLENLNEARGYYEKAIEEGDSETKGEAAINLAEVLIRLGENEQARQKLMAVSEQHSQATQVIDLLIELAFKEGKPSDAINWLRIGGEKYPLHFQDDFHSYREAEALLAEGKLDRAEEVIKTLEAKYSTGNRYAILSRAKLSHKLLATYLNEKKDSSASAALPDMPVASISEVGKVETKSRKTFIRSPGTIKKTNRKNGEQQRKRK